MSLVKSITYLFFFFIIIVKNLQSSAAIGRHRALHDVQIGRLSIDIDTELDDSIVIYNGSDIIVFRRVMGCSFLKVSEKIGSARL